jgi:hypothetical protein
MAKCIDCDHCDEEKMLCHPESVDCHEVYQLVETDLYTEARCDFFKERK